MIVQSYDKSISASKGPGRQRACPGASLSGKERQVDKAPDPIQELVAAARRKQILDAATRVFAEKGFHRATIKDIARVAGIADGTMYTYFASKTEVLLGILHRLNESTERE